MHEYIIFKVIRILMSVKCKKPVIWEKVIILNHQNNYCMNTKDTVSDIPQINTY